MAYMDDMAIEREKSKQALLAGKQPLLGDDSVKAMHALGVSLGLVPPGTPPSAMTQLLESFVRNGPKGIKVDDPKALQVSPVALNRTPSSTVNNYSDGGPDLGNTLRGLLDAAKVAKGKTIPKADERGASVRDAAVRGRRSEPAAAAPPIPGPYSKPMPAPGATTTGPADHAGGTGGGVAGDVPGLPGGPSGRALTPAERAATGSSYKADLQFLQERGGHTTQIIDGKKTDTPMDAKGSYGAVDPELAARLRASAEAYEKETGKKAKFGEFSRGDDVQKLYWEESGHGTKYAAARPSNEGGRGSNHLHGRAGDLPPGEYRDWLKAGNQEKYGLHFPVSGDEPHVEANPRFRQTLANPTASPAAQPAAAAEGGGPRASGVPPELSKLIMSKEWFVGTPKDDYGRKTIGYGTDAKGRSSITEPEARAEMNAQLQQHLDKIDQHFPNVSPDVRNSLASLTFNVGDSWITESGPGKGRLAAALKAGDMQTAKNVFNEFVHVTDKNGNRSVLPGLVNRRTDEARAFDGQKPQYTMNPDAPPGSQPDVAAPQAAAPAAAPQKMAPDFSRAATAAAPAAEPAAPATAFDKGRADAVPYSTVGGMYGPEYEAATTGATIPGPGTEELNAIKAPPRPPNQLPPVVVDAPAPAAARTAAPAATAAAAPVAPRPAPPPKPQTGLDKARALVDQPMRQIVTDPAERSQIPGWALEKTPRQLSQMPLVGGQFMSKAEPLFQKHGFTRDDATKALAEPPAAPGKRSDAGPQGGVQNVGLFDAIKERLSPTPSITAEQFKSMGDPAKEYSHMPVVDRFEYGGRDIPEPMPVINPTDPRQGPDVPRVPFGTPDYPLREIRSDTSAVRYGPRGQSGEGQRQLGERLGMDKKPNFDVGSQPAVQNADGNISTVRTMGFEDNGRQVNVPSVPAEGGRIMSNDEAYQRYKETGRHLGKYDSIPEAEAAAEALHQREAAQISQHPQGQQAPPQITPEMAKALENAFKDEARVPQAPPPPPEAMPVPAPQPMPGPQGTAGGLSLAPGGLSSLPSNAYMPATAGSQGGSIATAGLMPLPAIEQSTYSTPLLDSTAATGSMFGSSSLSPISPTLLNSWGWGGGSGFGGGGGFDFGGGGGFDFGGGGMSMPLSIGFTG